MPTRAICKECHAILYEGDNVIPTDEILQRYNGTCPKCGRKLSLAPHVKVKLERVWRR